MPANLNRTAFHSKVQLQTLNVDINKTGLHRYMTYSVI